MIVCAGVSRSLSACFVLLVAGCGGGGGGNSSESANAMWQISPSEVGMSAEMGGVPATGSFDVTNQSDDPIDFSVASDEDWLGVAPAQGSVLDGGTEQIALTGRCTEFGVNEAVITVEAAGSRKRLSAVLECRAPPVAIRIVESPAYDDGEPTDPPESLLRFALESQWQDREDVGYAVSSGNRLVSIDPESGEADIGDIVAVDLAIGRCDKVTLHQTVLTISADEAETVEVRWVADCLGGNPQILSVETFQGPLVEVRDFEGSNGVVVKKSGEDVSPVASRRAIVAVRYSHALPERPDLQARVLEGNDPPSGGRMLRYALQPRTVEAPPDFSKAPFASEVVFTLHDGGYLPGGRIVLEMDPFGDVAETDESDNVLSFDLPADMAEPAAINAYIVPVDRPVTESEAESEFDERRILPSLEVPESYFERIYDFLPVALHGAPDRFIRPTLRLRWHPRFDWEGALLELEFHRVSEAPSLDDYFIGVVAAPMAADEALCGIAYLRGKASLVAELEDSDEACGGRTVAHELGHNLGLRHANGGCGSVGHDTKFPYPGAGIGPNRAWWFSKGEFVAGQVAQTDGVLVPPGDQDHRDMMSYCRPAFVSDYTYQKALGFLLGDTGGNGVGEPMSANRETIVDSKQALPGASVCAPRSLAFAGRTDAEGVTVDLRTGFSAREAARGAAIDGTHTLTIFNGSGFLVASQRIDVLGTVHGQGGHLVWSCFATARRESSLYRPR